MFSKNFKSMRNSYAIILSGKSVIYIQHDLNYV